MTMLAASAQRAALVSIALLLAPVSRCYGADCCHSPVSGETRAVRTPEEYHEAFLDNRVSCLVLELDLYAPDAFPLGNCLEDDSIDCVTVTTEKHICSEPGQRRTVDLSRAEDYRAVLVEASGTVVFHDLNIRNVLTAQSPYVQFVQLTGGNVVMRGVTIETECDALGLDVMANMVFALGGIDALDMEQTPDGTVWINIFEQSFLSSSGYFVFEECQYACETVSEGSVAFMKGLKNCSVTGLLEPDDPLTALAAQAYRGPVSETVSGKDCIPWVRVKDFLGIVEGQKYSPFEPANVRMGLEGNSCRDPDGLGYVWCFTADGNKEACGPPACTNVSLSSVRRPGDRECGESTLQKRFPELYSRTVGDLPCARWDDSSLSHKFDKAELAGCLNPDGDRYFWCFVDKAEAGEAGEQLPEWQYCNVQDCIVPFSERKRMSWSQAPVSKLRAEGSSSTSTAVVAGAAAGAAGLVIAVALLMIRRGRRTRQTAASEVQYKVDDSVGIHIGDEESLCGEVDMQADGVLAGSLMGAYRVEAIIGSGTTCRCYRVRQGSQKFALKRIQNRYLLSTREVELFEILKEVRHPNLVQYVDLFPETDSMCLVQSLCVHGTLEVRIREQVKLGKPFPNSLVKDWVAQLASALACLHSHGVLHRDVKPGNILLESPSSLCIADLGSGAALDLNEPVTETLRGTPLYMAPEVCREELYSYPCDAWSLGCVIYEMLALQPTFRRGTLISVVAHISKASYERLPGGDFDPLVQLVDNLLLVDPTKRLTMEEILSLPWIFAGSAS